MKGFGIMQRFTQFITRNGKLKSENQAQAEKAVNTMSTHAISWEEKTKNNGALMKAVRFMAVETAPNQWRIEKSLFKEGAWHPMGSVQSAQNLSTRMALRMLEILEQNEARKHGVDLLEKLPFDGHYKMVRKMSGRDIEKMARNYQSPNQVH